MPTMTRIFSDPFLFADMSKIIDRIRVAREEKETVGIFGDYDADGITSSVILRKVLQRLDLPVIPLYSDKLTEGHGFTRMRSMPLSGRERNSCLRSTAA